MPFGYTKYLEDHGKSQKTVESYIKSIALFFNYTDYKYGKQKEIFEISPKDIKDFINQKLEEGSTVRTANKHLTILKGFFDYLWRIDKVPIDPAVKIRRLPVNDQKPNQLTYELLLETLPKVIQNPNYSNLRKSLFILALHGLRRSEFQISKGSVIDHGATVEILFPKRTILLKNTEAEIFLSYFFDSQFNGSDYVFTTKKHGESIVPIEHMSLHTHLNGISEDYKFPMKITPTIIRHSYAYYLYTVKRMVVEQVASIFGIEVASAAQLIKISMDRHHKGKELLEMKSNNIVK